MTPVRDAAGEPPPPGAIAAAATALAAGGVIGLPTDTVYGLAADPTSAGGTAGLFSAKQRPSSVELPVLVADLDQAEAVAGRLPAAFRRLAERWWPGALTIVVPRRAGIGYHLGGDGTSIGLRCPDHPVAIAVCRAAGPIATTSANLHGGAPATTAAEVAALRGVDLVLDAGPCPARPSTVVSLLGPSPEILRDGPLPKAEVLGVAAAGPPGP